MSRGFTRDFALEVSKGKVPGHAMMFIAVDSSVIGTSFTTFWDLATDLVYATGGEALEILSTSANDTAAGTGARTVLVSGLDSTYTAQTEVVTLNGTSTVATVATNWLSISNIVVLTSGSGETNAGVLTLRVTSAGNVRATALAGNSRSFNSNYAVPATKTAFILQAQIWAPKGDDIIVKPSFMGFGSSTWISGGIVPSYQGQVGVSYESKLRVAPKTLFKWEAKSTNSNQEGSLLLELMEIDTDLLD
jgi:hypothetical protein